jgi:CheY-like chemotaxis protein
MTPALIRRQSVRPPDTRPSRLSKKQILVVEDDEAIRLVLSDLLSDAGYEVLLAGDGNDAFVRLGQNSPDLIVLDLMMPGMSGWRFLETLDKHPGAQRVPVVIVSAIDGRHDYPSQLGAEAWLCKPIDVTRLLATVTQLTSVPVASMAVAGHGFRAGRGRTRGRALAVHADCNHFAQGWDAALLDIEHQAEHWDTPDHGQTGYLIAQALHAAVDIARAGGLRCEHR